MIVFSFIMHFQCNHNIKIKSNVKITILSIKLYKSCMHWFAQIITSLTNLVCTKVLPFNFICICICFGWILKHKITKSQHCNFSRFFENWKSHKIQLLGEGKLFITTIFVCPKTQAGRRPAIYGKKGSFLGNPRFSCCFECMLYYIVHDLHTCCLYLLGHVHCHVYTDY